jgi:RNA polymerase sigma-70 factor (ECF subfamily)
VLSPPPETLVAACCAGDRDAFARLFDLCRDRVYGIALHMCGDPSQAADITQDVFMKLLTRLPQFGARAAFSTWLYRIVVNTAIDYQRRSRRIVPLAETIPDHRRPADDEVLRGERRRRIGAALQALPAKLRAPIVLRHVEGLAYEQIASALGVSIGTVSSRLARGHARLARELADL